MIYSDNQTSTPKNKQLEISKISVKEVSNVKNKDNAEILKSESSINNTPKPSNKCRLSRVKKSLSFEHVLPTSTCATLDILNSTVNKSNISKTEEEIKSVSYIELSSEEIAINEETKFWLKELHLKDPDKVVLQNPGKWLNDTIINASMKI